MTDNELRLLGEMVKKAVADALAKPLERLTQLETVARRHPPAQLAADLRKSQSEVTLHVDDTTGALVRRDEHIVGALNEVRDQIAIANKAALVEVINVDGVKSIRPAAPVAAETALATQGTVKATQVAANRADTNALAAKVGSHRALIAQVVSTIILILWQLWEHLK